MCHSHQGQFGPINSLAAHVLGVRYFSAGPPIARSSQTPPTLFMTPSSKCSCLENLEPDPQGSWIGPEGQVLQVPECLKQWFSVSIKVESSHGSRLEQSHSLGQAL
jgi:hypothetical protein